MSFKAHAHPTNKNRVLLPIGWEEWSNLSVLSKNLVLQTCDYRETSVGVDGVVTSVPKSIVEAAFGYNVVAACSR